MIIEDAYTKPSATLTHHEPQTMNNRENPKPSIIRLATGGGRGGRGSIAEELPPMLVGILGWSLIRQQ